MLEKRLVTPHPHLKGPISAALPALSTVKPLRNKTKKTKQFTSYILSVMLPSDYDKIKVTSFNNEYTHVLFCIATLFRVV